MTWCSLRVFIWRWKNEKFVKILWLIFNLFAVSSLLEGDAGDERTEPLQVCRRACTGWSSAETSKVHPRRKTCLTFMVIILRDRTLKNNI